MIVKPEEQLQEILRGAVDILPGPEELLKKLQTSYDTKKPLNIKFGADPSRPDLHLGHTVVIQKLRTFQNFGHKVQFLIGDFTARIGDPTGRNKTRPELSQEDIQVNSQTYKDQVMKILDPDKTEIFYNSAWLNALDPMDFVRLLASHTVQQLMVREDFQNRYKEQNPIFLHELLYPLLQGYDSVAMNSDVELGGTDQTFNLLMGRELQKHYHKQQQIVLTMPLLEGLDGVQKMSKSYDNYIGVTDSPKDMFGKTMSISDQHMIRFYELLSQLSYKEIEVMKQHLASGKLHPMNLKKDLAQELVSRYWGVTEGQKAREEFEQIFSKKEIPDSMLEVQKPWGEILDLGQFFVDIRFAESKSEVRRMLEQRGIKHNQKVVSELRFILSPEEKEYVLRFGKLKWVRILPSDSEGYIKKA